MRHVHVLILAFLVLICVSVGLVEAGGARPRTSEALSQQGVPVRVPDSSVSQPGSWPQQGTKKKTVDVTKLKSNADELITLSQGLPTQLDQIGNGKLPKDLLDSLRKIEKLSKHMRSELE